MLVKTLPLIVFILSFISPEQAIAQDELEERIDTFACLLVMSGEEPESLRQWYKEWGKRGEKFQFLEGPIGRMETDTVFRFWAYINPVPPLEEDYESTSEKKLLNRRQSHCFLRSGKKVEVVDTFADRGWLDSLSDLFPYSDFTDGSFVSKRKFAYVSVLGTSRSCLQPITYLLELKSCELGEGGKVRINVSTANERGEQQKGVLVEL